MSSVASRKGGAFGLGRGGPRLNRRVLRDNIQGLTKPAIQRLAHVAGVKSISGSVYEEMRGIIRVYMEMVIQNALIYCEHARRKAVKSDDVLHALERLTAGTSTIKKLYHTGESKASKCKLYKTSEHTGDKKPRKKRGTRALSEIRFYQKTSVDCVHFAKDPFKRLVREIAQDLMSDLGFTAAAIVTIQLATESYVIQLFEKAVMLAIHAHREMVYPKDLQLLRRISGEVNS